MFILTISMALAGCESHNSEIESDLGAGDEQTQTEDSSGREIDNRPAGFDDRFEEVGISALIIGQQISVVGTEDVSGIMSASQIVIGDLTDEFAKQAGAIEINNDDFNSTMVDENEVPKFMGVGDGQRPNFDEMSEEERTAMMEKTQSQRESSVGRGLNSVSSSVTRLSGEILEIDPTTLTLKIETAGSKLIFYSAQTKILKLKE